jgi:uncharacterized repeat protein (TIGR01451 family)
MRSIRMAALASICSVAALAAASLAPASASAGVAAEKVLILDSTVTGGSSSPEAQAATAAGFGVDVVTPTQWAAMTQAQFASYRAIVFGDPTCTSTSTGPLAAAEANRTTWSPVVDGNIVVIGTDPAYHKSHGVTGAGKLITSAMNFTVDQAGKTGLYADMSCYYDNGSSNADVTVLDQFGAFKASDASTGCANNIHIVASHPALAGLTDADLSNWSCSVHEYFDAYPSDFTPLAIDTDGPPTYEATDGAQGTPYILARGAGLSSSGISLTPANQSRQVATNANLTAFVEAGGTPQSGVTVTFTVTSGPNTGHTGTAITGSDGKASFSYTSALTGTDTVSASFVDSSAHTQTSNDATVDWTAPPPSANLSIVKTDSPDPVSVGQTLTYNLAVKNNGPSPATGVKTTDHLPAGVTFQGASTSQGSCSLSSGTVTCNLGNLANGASATVTIKVVPQSSGSLSNTATVQGNEADPQSSNNSSTQGTTVNAGSQPKAGKTGNAHLDSGIVFVSCPGQPSHQLKKDEVVKFPCTLDTNNGFVSLTWSNGHGGTETMTFWDGTFVLTQPKVSGQFLTTLTLAGPPLTCPSPGDLFAARRRHHLFGRGRGHARSRSRHSGTTVRGTYWLTEERCDGTLTKVFKGTVSVFDFETKKTHIVTAPNSYFARAEDPD